MEPTEPPVDGLGAIIDIAQEVALENDPDPGMTRVERLARFVRANFVDAMYARTQAGSVSRCTVVSGGRPSDPIGYGRVDVQRVAHRMAISTRHSLGDVPSFVPLKPSEARALAAALLVEAEDAERAARVVASRPEATPVGAPPPVAPPPPSYRSEF